ncbi:MAG: hypothetical protein RQ867_08570 [Mariprofundaceae bacterium]|nr:hypothetical protein [Mariprofundaceae bacterium]
MKLMRRNHNRLSVTLTLVFAMQILASSLCISTAAQAMETVSLNHCHQSMEHSNMQHEMGSRSMQAQPEQLPISACSHCASPDDFAVFVNDLDSSPVGFLIAFVASGETANPSATVSLSLSERALAPPRSSTTLYTTTRRIRV